MGVGVRLCVAALVPPAGVSQQKNAYFGSYRRNECVVYRRSIDLESGGGWRNKRNAARVRGRCLGAGQLLLRSCLRTQREDRE